MDWLEKRWDIEVQGDNPIEAAEKVIAEFKKQSETGWWAGNAKAVVTDLFTMSLDPFNKKWMARIVFDLEFFEKRVA